MKSKNDKASRPVAWAHVLDMSALQTVLGCAASHIEDIESGIADGTYLALDNEGLPDMQAALKSVEGWHACNTPSAMSANKDRAGNFDAEYQAVCLGQGWSLDSEKTHLLNFVRKSGMLAQFLEHVKEAAADENFETQ
jgi:hypothetical protein